MLGAVNRCWRCGTPFVSRTGPADLPPVRRTPVEMPAQATTEAAETRVVDRAEAEIARGEGDADVAASEVEAASTSTNVGDSASTAVATSDHDAATKQPVVRRGSPFASSPPHAAATTTVPPAKPQSYYGPPASYPRHAAAIGGAIAALLLGVLSLLGAFYIPVGGLITSVVGLVMGVWGLYSERRGVAIAGLLLCCVALAIAGFNGTIELYTWINGHGPWDASTDIDILRE